jgi:hypothetical protein
MGVKHKVLKDFQLLTNDKKIIILKAKTVLENYTYITKNDNVLVEKDIIDNNPDFFSLIDWKEELNTYLKQNKIPQPAVITKKLVPFIEEMFVITKETNTVYVPVNLPVSVQDSDIHLREIELESNLKKVEIRDTKLREELEKVHFLESELIEKEKNLEKKHQYHLKKDKELSDKQAELDKKEKTLNEREMVVSEKENNLSQFVDRQKVADFVNSKSNAWSSDLCREISGYISSL